jgi:hypothetical protein
MSFNQSINSIRTPMENLIRLKDYREVYNSLKEIRDALKLLTKLESHITKLLEESKIKQENL